MKRNTLPAIVLALTGVLFSPGFPFAQGGGPDGFGYTWVNSVSPDPLTAFNWVEISSTGTNSGVTGDDVASGYICMKPEESGECKFLFFPFYGQTFKELAFSTNGIVAFGGASSRYLLPPIPSTTDPNNFIAVFLADLYVYSDGAIYYQPFPEGLPASADKRPAFVVEWSNVGFWCNPRLAPDKLADCLESRATFEVILFENGEIKIQYGNIKGPTNSATVGIENSGGTIGLQYNYNGTGGPIENETAVLFVPPTTAQPPVISSISATPSDGAAPLTVTFDLVTSDPDGTIASVQWDFDGDGITDASDVVNQPSPSLSRLFTYCTPGTFKARVTVIDNTGAPTSASTPVTVFSGTISPTTTAMVEPPANGAGWNKTDVTVTLTAADNPGGCGVQSITYSLTGAQTGIYSVNASTASFAITAEGTTKVTFHASGNSGKVEADETLIVRIDKTAPAVTPPPDPLVEATSSAGAMVTFASSAKDNLDPAPVVTASPQSGSTFPLGTTTVTVMAKDAAGNIGTGTFTVTVRDTTPPTATLTLTPTILWPPNHRMVAITPTLTASDLTGPVTVSGPTVTSNEAPGGLGAGDPSPSWTLSGTNGIQLRAERDGKGDGRIYTITYIVTDQSGNSASVSATVLVPSSPVQ